SITPTTNPTETIINNGIGMVAGGNAVVFNAHPYAARTSAFMLDKFNDAIVTADGAEDPARLRRTPDDRERRGADDVPWRAPAGRHGWARRRGGRDGQRQQGDRR